MHVDDISISEIVFGVPPTLVEYIKLFKSGKEIWIHSNTFTKVSENVKYKILSSVVNDYNIFSTTTGELVAFTTNHYRISVNNLTTHGMTRTPIEHKIKFINSLGKG